MKKKIISLAAILVLASMMLVMFTGCSGYTKMKTCRIAGNEEYEYFIVNLYQRYDDSDKKYDKNKFQVEVCFEYKGREQYKGEVACSYKELSSGVQVQTEDIYYGFPMMKPSIYITGVTLDKTGKISNSCTPQCEMRLEGRQYKVKMVTEK